MPPASPGARPAPGLAGPSSSPSGHAPPPDVAGRMGVAYVEREGGGGSVRDGERRRSEEKGVPFESEKKKRRRRRTRKNEILTPARILPSASIHARSDASEERSRASARSWSSRARARARAAARRAAGAAVASASAASASASAVAARSISSRFLISARASLCCFSASSLALWVAERSRDASARRAEDRCQPANEAAAAEAALAAAAELAAASLRADACCLPS